jgi:hypothetical protein
MDGPSIIGGVTLIVFGGRAVEGSTKSYHEHVPVIF